MNIPLIRKDGPSAAMQSISIRNSSDELLRQLAERARTQRLRHQLERTQSGNSRRSRRAGAAVGDESGGVTGQQGLRKPALTAIAV
jgi:hypothetical protein